MRNESFILGSVNDWQHYHNHLYRIFQHAGFTINAVQHAYNSEGIFGLVACEMGITIHCSSAANYIRKGLVIREIEGIDDTIPTQAVWNKTKPSPVTGAFAEFIGA